MSHLSFSLRNIAWLKQGALGSAAVLALSAICLLIPAQSLAQGPGMHGAFTVSTAGVVVNQYAILGANAAAGASSITVTDITHFSTVSPFTGANRLSDGELLLIIQMQGASVRTTDDADYGVVTNYNGAGTYEFVYVNGATNTNTINLKCALKNSYTTAGRTQVVRVPQFTTLTINDNSYITSIPWNYTSTTLFRDIAGASASIQQLSIVPNPAATFPAGSPNRGGIVAVHVSGTMTLNGSINVTGHGFRPGLIDGTTSAADATIYSFYRTPNDFGGASKGESIAGYHTDYDAFGGRYGRGATANGGGGGNAHNGAGGGGANGHNGTPRFRGAGIMSIDVASWAQAWALDADFIANGNTLVTANSGGGRGGYTYASSNQNALLVGPSNSAWGGDRRDPSGGLGGHALVNIADSRIFMGGGGGAGENNSGSAERGGRGGGIVYVFANAITRTTAGTVATDGQIIANGEGSPKTRNGTPGLNGGNDGASGGGGGGSILVNTGALDANADLVANGGDGGDQEIDITHFAAESEGAGGGGGGGYIAATVTLTAGSNAFVNGGQYGTSNSNAVTEFIPNGATSGCTGLIESGVLSSTTIPSFVAACNVDFDEDGIDDPLDIDDDNDGIPDAYDVCPVAASSVTDFDCLQDVLDNDLVNGTGAGIDPSADEDNDGILNYLDKTDNDGSSDFFNSCTDANADGVCDNLPLIIDRDRDGVPNFYDRDSDGDGIADIIEIGGMDIGDGQISAMYDGADLLLDFDEDGAVATGDPDADTDSDGLLATYDADGEGGVSLVTSIPDKDADGIPNFLDLDSDNDGIPDVIEAGGNDSDGDGKPDVTSDGDGDGYSDAYDQDQDGKLGLDGGTVQTLVYGIDLDGDNILDAGEYATSSTTFFLSPDNHNYGGAGLTPTRFAVDNLVNWLDLESDGDGIPDLVEAGGADDNNNGQVDVATDSDLDGYADIYDSDIDLTLGVDAGREARPLVLTLFDNNADGLNAEGYVTSDDIDSDRYPNSLDLDSDDDGMPDFPEATLYLDAGGNGRADNDEPTATTRNYHPASGAYADSDSDGWGNVAEATPVLDPPNDANADGKITTEWYTSSGSASPNFDGDIVPDLYDFDSDNDGILDSDEMSTSASAVFPNSTKSGSTIGYANNMRTRYASSGGFAPPNSDAAADGYDYRDTDSDSDNHRDWIEGRDGTNDANTDALQEYILAATAWRTANCPSSLTGCTIYTTTDADADGYPAWLDQDDATPVSNQGANFLAPFLDRVNFPALYADDDADGLVDLFDPTYSGTPSTEPASTGVSTPSFFAQAAAAGVPSYRNNVVNVTLPVEWILAEVQPNGDNSVINWQLSDENLVDFYQVERSLTGQPDDFTSVSNPINATEANEAHSFTDAAALKSFMSTIYYRVRAVGVNGGASYSATLTISAQGRPIHMVAYPNPAHETLTVETTLQENATLRLISTIGQTVLSLPINAGTTVQRLSIGAVPPGLYLLVLSDGSSQVPVLIQ